MKDLRAVRGKYYIHKLIEQGEHENQDFKYMISDARKIARSLSAFANHSGGRLLIGVKDNGTVAGVRSEEDVYMIETAAAIYCDPPQEVAFAAYKVDDGAVVVVAEIAPATAKPVRVKEADGNLRAYYRVADENIAAAPLMVRAWMRQARSGGELLTLSDTETTLMEILARGMVTADDLAATVAASRRSIEEAIVRMAAMGSVEFVYTDGQFRLRIASVE